LARVVQSAVQVVVLEKAEGRAIARRLFRLAASVPALAPGHRVEGREAHADPEARGFGPHARHDLAEEPGAVLESPAVAAFSLAPGERPGAERAVAVLDVHEVEPRLASQARGPDEARDELVDVAVAEKPHAAREAPVEHGVAIGHERFGATVLGGVGEAARV